MFWVKGINAHFGLEKAYDSTLKEVMLRALEKKEVHLYYTKLIKEMCDGAVTNMRTSGDITSEFPIITRLHQGSSLCL